MNIIILVDGFLIAKNRVAKSTLLNFSDTKVLLTNNAYAEPKKRILCCISWWDNEIVTPTKLILSEAYLHYNYTYLHIYMLGAMWESVNFNPLMHLYNV